MKLLLENWRKFLKEEKGRVNIFLDMDGVLVNFPDTVKDEIKKNNLLSPEEVHPTSKSGRALLRKLQKLQFSSEQIEDLYNQVEIKFQEGGLYNQNEKIMRSYIFKVLTNNKGLWLRMEELEGATALVDEVFNLADEVFVLTAQVDEQSEEAKREWIGSHFPQINPNNINVDRDKGGRLRQLISDGVVSEDDLNILIDDRVKYLNSFINAGGTGIQYDHRSPNVAIEELKAVVGN